MSTIDKMKAVLSVLLITFTIAVSAQNKRPNILVVMCDDLGYGDVGFNGSKDIITPELDKLAKNGTIFSSAYVAHPFCGPSRSGFITGRYPQVTGTPYNLSDENSQGTFGVPVSETFMSSTLQRAGYYTGIVGKWHLGYDSAHHPNNRGFDNFYGFLGGGHKYFPDLYKKAYASQVANGKKKDEINVYLLPLEHNGKDVEETEYVTDAFSREAINMVNDAAGKNKPFFLYLAYNAPHQPLEAKPEDLKVFEHIENKQRRTYAAMVYAVDRGVGKIVQALKDNHQFENTLIVFLSDNGAHSNDFGSNAPLRGLKGDTWEGGYRVPMFFHWPGNVPAGKKFDHAVSALDFYPTFAALAGAKIPSGKILDGKNIFKDVVSGTDPRKNDLIYALRYRAGFCDVGARLGDWKVTKMNNQPWQLFNIKEDIGEANDLSKTHPEKLKQLIGDTEKWSRTHITPLWFYTEKDAEMWKSGKLPNYKSLFQVK